MQPVKLEEVRMEPRRSWEGLPMAGMAVGQSFLIAPSIFGTLSSAEVAGRVRMKAKRLGIKVQIRQRTKDKHQEDGLRVERLA